MPASLTSSELIEALESLGWKSLERTKSSENKDLIETLFTLQPVIKKYVINIIYHQIRERSKKIIVILSNLTLFRLHPICHYPLSIM